MSYNRGKKKFKKNKQNQKGNNLSLMDRVEKMFGNPDLKVMYLGKKKHNLSDEETKERHDLGNKEFQKIINSIKTKKYIKDKLLKIYSNDYVLYKKIVKYFLYYPYFDFGNKHQEWFDYFYDFISELPGLGELVKNPNPSPIGIPVFRSMLKSEFEKMLENGVQHPSFTGNISTLPKFIKQQTLTSDEEVVVVGCFIKEEDIILDPTIDDQNFGNEYEYWIRKNTKPIRTNVIGTYNKEHLLTTFNDPKNISSLIERYKEVYINSNGFVDKTQVRNEVENHFNENSDDILLKFGKKDLPKLITKWINDKKLNSMSNDMMNQLIGLINDWLSNKEVTFNKLTPVLI